MPQATKKNHLVTGAVATTAACLALLVLGACTTLEPGTGPTEDPAASLSVDAIHPTASVPEIVAVQPGTVATAAEKTYSAASIKVLEQKAVQDARGKNLELRIQAPANSSFAIGNGSSSAGCDSSVQDPDAVLYLVRCPDTGPGQELTSAILDGAFEYRFTTALK